MTIGARRACAAVLAAMLLVLMTPGVPAAAATGDPDLGVRITQLGPSSLEPGDTVTLAGTVTNRGSRGWTDVQAYLVIPFSPFTTRDQVESAVGDGNAYTGERVVEIDTFDEVGTLGPGRSRTFRIRVPYESLGIGGAEGVYPVGVQILATDADGNRSTTAVGRATSFLPMLSPDRETTAVTGGVVWPFLMPDRRGADGRYVGSERFAASVSAGGQLRNLLDLARATPMAGSTVVLDPALLVGLDDLAQARGLTEGFEPTTEQRAAAQQLLDDLVTFSRRTTTWVVGYDRPDVLAIDRAGESGEALTRAVDRATDATLARFGVTGRRVTWPTRTGVTEDLLAAVRGSGEEPVIVSAEAASGWQPRLGSVVRHDTPAGPVPLLITSALDEGVPGARTPTTLRQRLLAEAALATLQRSTDPQSRADAVAVVDPQWNPGRLGSAGLLDPFLDSDLVRPAGLDEVLGRPVSSYDGPLPRSADAAPLAQSHVAAVVDAVQGIRTLVSLVPDSDQLEETGARRVAEAMAVKWRLDREQGVASARALARRAASDLASITVEGPPAVTLSSSEGSFPITISNGSEQGVEVGVQVGSSNPNLSIPDVEPVMVAAGQRLTVTVNADVGSQSSSTFTAQMVTRDGDELGEPAVFNVRSSRVGVAVWVAMGAAGLLVVAALARRFLTRGAQDGRPERGRVETPQTGEGQ